MRGRPAPITQRKFHLTLFPFLWRPLVPLSGVFCKCLACVTGRIQRFRDDCSLSVGCGGVNQLPLNNLFWLMSVFTSHAVTWVYLKYPDMRCASTSSCVHLPFLELFWGDESGSQVAVSHAFCLPPRGVILSNNLQDVSPFEGKSRFLAGCGFIL